MGGGTSKPKHAAQDPGFTGAAVVEVNKKASNSRNGKLKASRRLSFGSSTRNVDLDNALDKPEENTQAAIVDGKGYESAFSSQRHTVSFRVSYIERSKEGRNSSPQIFPSHDPSHSLNSKKIASVRSRGKSKSDGIQFFQDTLVQEAEEGHRYIFFGVVEGFGKDPSGVASFVRLFFASKLRHSRRLHKFIGPELAQTVLKETFEDLWETMQAEQSAVDLKESGAVCTVVYYGERTVVSCCVGNSKAFQYFSSKREAQELSPNHTWSNEEERARAASLGADIRINSIDNVGEVGAEAVFYNKVAQLPGLPMTRIIGFTNASDKCGLKHEAEMKVVKLDDLDEKPDTIILATNGLWNVLPQEQVLDIVAEARSHQRISSYVDAQDLSSRLLRQAADKWAELWTDNSIQVECFYPDLFERSGIVTPMLHGFDK